MRRLIFICLLLTGCAGSGQHGIGSASAPRETVKLGVIESVAPIEMDASSNAGSMAGGIFGQVGGANTGTGRSSAVGSIFGSVLGSTLGHQAGIASRQGLELWIKIDGAEQSSYVMQPGKPDAFRVGDRVRIVSKKGSTQVELDTPPATKP
jgi:outer membrane lipoprotein SlyB